LKGTEDRSKFICTRMIGGFFFAEAQERLEKCLAPGIVR
jgi:hypothetical protein